jgi:hypothetical protein
MKKTLVDFHAFIQVNKTNVQKIGSQHQKYMKRLKR